MDLIVTGGGSGKDTLEIDRLFASKLDKNKKLLYIPIAIDNIKHPYPSCLNWLKSTFDNLGVKKYEMWIEKDLKKAKETDPSEFAGIYIGGGNTPYLLKKLRESGFLNFLKEALKKEVPVYGGSAGAILFSKTIISSLKYDKNWSDLQDFTGLNLIGGYEITCHYSDKEKRLITELVKENNIPHLIALTEKNALYITKEKMVLIGKEDAIYFKNGVRTILPLGESIPKIL